MSDRERGSNSLADPGSYVLVFACPERARVRVGALGDVDLERGHLVYVGSAFGAGGIAGRLRHHLRPIRRPRWHVDYVRPHVELLGAWCANGPRSLEHGWARALTGLPGFAVAAPGFGASDCRCAGHLLHARRRPTGRGVGEPLAQARSGVRIEYLRRPRLERALATRAAGSGSAA